MPDDERLDDLERYLIAAPVLYAATNPQSGANVSYLAVLEGGVGVLVKPEDSSAHGPESLRREAAAWVVARGLGWPDIVSATVLRSVSSVQQPGTQVPASVQVLWPSNQPGMPEDRLPEEDLWRAAVFDTLVCHGDRHGGNWLGVPKDGAPSRLKLVDHGLSFARQGPPQSPFFNRYRGKQVPAELTVAVQALLSSRHATALEQLLDQDAVEGLRERAQRLISTGVLDAA